MLTSKQVLLDELNHIGGYLVEVLKKELAAQGHRASGKLERSIQSNVKHQGGDLTIDFSHEHYGTYVNTGVPAFRIPYSPGSGASTSKYIQGLIRWVQLKGIAPGFAGAKRIAFAIARTHKKEGMPSKNSYTFSNNGRRTKWIDHPAQALGRTIQRKAEAAISKAYDAEIAHMINLVSSKFPDSIKLL